MNDLREAIRTTLGEYGLLPGDDAFHEGVDRALVAVFEAYMREHDAQAMQRIEALPAPYWPYDAAAASTGWDMAMSAVLEALASR